MADQVLYRKYRSARFEEVVGQDHVVKTLLSALASGHTSHAYLFTGPRGVGKTSVARLLARALNCTGAEPKPCNACPNCQAALSASLDLIEIDAASNRSIDSIRDLKDKISLAPTQGQYKIYIIDEVHMLTSEAFNALLKTLEEPPAHAVFILATTEAHKLPATIVSRTQRFAFKPIARANLVSHLTTIAKAEKITIEPAALEVIAAAAGGSFRDAISLLDQLASTGASPIAASAARDLLGYTDAEAVAAVSAALAAGDTRTALEAVAKLEAAGAPAAQLTAQLIEYWRGVLLAGAGASPHHAAANPPDVPPARSAQIVQALLEVSRSHWPQLALEATIVQLTATTAPATPTPTPQAKTPPPTTTSAPAPAAAPTAAPAPTASPAPAVPAPEAPTPSAGGALAPELWPKVLVLLKSRSNSLAALLQMYPVQFGDGHITIKARFNFHRDLFLKPANAKLIEAAAAKVYGQPVKISARTDDAAAPAAAARPDPSAELVSSALEILGGEVVE